MKLALLSDIHSNLEALDAVLSALPEVDRVAWFGTEEARRRAHPVQAAFVDRLQAQLEPPPGDTPGS